MPAVSVTIVNHQACDHLRKCLQSIEQHPCTVGSLEIVVLDNASGDGSVEMLRNEFPDVVVLAEETRRGFGANQNRAIAASRGDLVLMLNPDATVGEGTIDSLARAVWNDERVIAAGCPVVNSDGSLRQDWPFRFPTPLSIYSKAVGVNRLLESRRSRSNTFRDRWLGGYGLIVDRREFLDVGGFDDGFFMYSEDVDLCRRLRDRGHYFGWAAHASVVHPVPTDDAALLRRRQYEIMRGELIYMRKYYGRIGQFVYRIGAAFDGAIRVVALSLPFLSRAIDIHGTSAADTRSLYFERLKAAVWPSSGEGLSDLAAQWNAGRDRPRT